LLWSCRKSNTINYWWWYFISRSS